MRNLLLAGVALVAISGTAQASVLVEASLFSPLPPAGTTTTIVDLQTGTGQTTFNGTGYTISFTSVGANQGFVQGDVPSTSHATPVAGVNGSGQATYLTGNFGSSQTTNPVSGHYLSTGLGTITLTFATAQTSLALLWGSIDAGNKITFNDAAGDSVTGLQAQAAATGFASNGFQGPGGSAYIVATTNTPFTTVTFTSDVVSFELAGIAASTARFAVPEPASMALLGAGLFGVGLIRRRRKA